MNLDPEIVPVTFIICILIGFIFLISAIRDYSITELNYTCVKKDLK